MSAVLMTGRTVTAELCNREIFWCWPDNCRLSQLSVCLSGSDRIDRRRQSCITLNTCPLLHKLWEDRQFDNNTMISLLSKYQQQQKGTMFIFLLPTLGSYFILKGHLINNLVYSEKQWESLNISSIYWGKNTLYLFFFLSWHTHIYVLKTISWLF